MYFGIISITYRAYAYSSTGLALEEKESDGHANAFVIDSKYKTLERWEPNGQHGTKRNYMDVVSDEIDEIMNQICEANEYTYIPPVQLCPGLGPQSRVAIDHIIVSTYGDEPENQDVKNNVQRLVDEMQILDTCSLWSFYYLDQRIQHPDHSGVSVVRQMMRDIGDETLDYTIWIQNYILKMNEIVHSMYKESVERLNKSQN
jgi:hypothetical protein